MRLTPKKIGRYASVRTMRKTLVPMAALLVLFTAGFSLESWQTNKNEQARELAALAEMGAAALDSYFVHFEGTLQLAAKTALREPDDVRRSILLFSSLHAVYPELEGLAVVPADAATRAATVVPERKEAPASTENADAGAIVIGRPTWSAAAGDWLIPLSYPLRDATGTALHAVELALPLSITYRLWKNAPLPDGGRLGVMRDDGYLVTLYPLPDAEDVKALYEQRRSHSPLYSHVSANRYPTQGMTEGVGSYGGSMRLWVYRRLEHYPLTLYTSLPRGYLWATWWRRVRHSYLLLALSILGAALVYRWILQRQSAWEFSQEKANRRIRRLNAALGQRVAQLEASNHELEAFSYTVSHDLRGPLRVIHGFTDRLASQQADRLDVQGRHYLERIRVGAQRMGALVDGLLQLSRVTRAKVELQEVDLTHEARSLGRELAQMWPDREVRFSVEEGLTARGSAALLRDLLRNLLENAWKFTAHRPQPTVTFGSEQRQQERVYYVRDNGAGFDMRYAAKLFSAFQRLHGAEYEGIGIGLATVARIVAMHGGRIWAQAKKDEGATFYFTLKRPEGVPVAQRAVR